VPAAHNINFVFLGVLRAFVVKTTVGRGVEEGQVNPSAQDVNPTNKEGGPPVAFLVCPYECRTTALS
jgi:hypothetical protein